MPPFISSSSYDLKLLDLHGNEVMKNESLLRQILIFFFGLVCQALLNIPWDVKPIYGIITDTFPIAGYNLL